LNSLKETKRLSKLREESEGGTIIWLEKNNPKIAKGLMTKQMEEKKKYGKKKNQ
jgi:hypothetical protein